MEYGAVLFKPLSKPIAILAIFAVLGLGLPAGAESDAQPAQVAGDQNAPAQSEALPKKKSTLIAQASCGSCGCSLLDPLALAESAGKRRSKTVLTDSLWGNLILEMAYQRDKELQKFARRMNIVNLGTLGALSAIAGGTLAQGIVALQTLNPPPGIEDSYAPGIIGVALSSATILTIAARTCLSRHLQKQLHTRQLAIKNRVEAILHHLEYSETRCADARQELAELVGPRACREWIQLWQSSHQLAISGERRISLLDAPR